MNCKEGDLAIVVNSAEIFNIGKVVEVLRPAIFGEEFSDITGELIIRTSRGDSAWVVRCESGIWWSAIDGPEIGEFVERAIGDERLRPLRNDHGADETLSWCDLPSEVKA